MITRTEKKCPHCQEVKKIHDFYVSRARSDGHASWCKVCTNSTRKSYHQSRPTVVYAKLESPPKPEACEDCNKKENRLRRLFSPEDPVRWLCYSCHAAVVAAERAAGLRPPKKTHRHYCGWCNSGYYFTEAGSDDEFCSLDCRYAARKAKVRREGTTHDAVLVALEQQIRENDWAATPVPIQDALNHPEMIH